MQSTCKTRHNKKNPFRVPVFQLASDYTLVVVCLVKVAGE